MLQNLSMDKRKETHWQQWTRQVRHDEWHGMKNRRLLFKEGINDRIEPKITIPGFRRFTPTGITGVYIADINIDADSINACTKQHADWRNCVMYDREWKMDRYTYFLCDNPEQARDFYNNRLEHTGNHVIILWPLSDFRWHKWGEYIGTTFADARCEYFSEDCERLGVTNPTIYAANIYKVH